MEIPWWTYGARGMQLWFPSSLSETLSPRSEAVSKSVDPELEFDKEVYPIGISLAEVAIIGQPPTPVLSLVRPQAPGTRGVAWLLEDGWAGGRRGQGGGGEYEHAMTFEGVV